MKAHEREMAGRMAGFAISLLTGPRLDDARTLTGDLTVPDMVTGSMRAAGTGITGLASMLKITHAEAADGVVVLLKERASTNAWDLPPEVYTGAEAAAHHLARTLDTGEPFNPLELGFGDQIDQVSLATTMAVVWALSMVMGTSIDGAGQVLCTHIAATKVDD